MAKTVKAERMEQVRLFLESEKDLAGWCAESGLTERTMSRWIEEYEASSEAGGPDGGWVTLQAAATGAEPPALTARIGRVGIVVPHGADEADVAALLRAASSL